MRKIEERERENAWEREMNEKENETWEWIRKKEGNARDGRGEG